MYSDQLLSKQGPLAHVWLAANYDKKLSKQQLLNTNIIQSSRIISTHPISYQSSQNSQTTTEGNGKTITLRLSGQLLLGIVRIYSRKTKYLLDDVNDILYKLKNSFKYANGGVFLGSELSKNSINLAPRQTIVSNVESITLTDQVADFDLLYQEDLNLGDEMGTTNTNTLFSQISNANSLNDSSFNYDQSIEMPRFNDSTMNNPNNDDDLELDFELGDNDNDNTFDQSIEVGRNVSQLPENSPDVSILSDLNKDNSMQNDDNTGLEFDFDNPLETIDESRPINEENVDSETSDNNEPITPPSISRPRSKLVGITEEGQLKTTKRKLKVDSNEELDMGISIESLRNNQRLQLNNEALDEYLTLRLSETEKIQLIHELSSPVNSANKRRKLWNIDEHLQQRCLELSHDEQTIEYNNQLQTDNQQFDDFDDNLDFDISLPGLETEADITGNTLESAQFEGGNEDEEEEFSNEVVTKSTIQIADQLRETFSNNVEDVVNLTEMIEKDLQILDRDETKVPLGVANKSSENIRVNKRREATKCFFELLVLATNDCISIEQESPSSTNKTGGKINIRSRDRIFNQFL
ncbi:DEHA2A14058p [Debaryomyces hansenii CBS767]|uniref:DEHA2A14058p n=1 Tax=Debaryomyces hansenii (strain ATCC 36239 / CBS 767 / BCRC 21394 / JCM 1990 / NBRC 0083 / IGC 2968) TaxID=284592 RepID=Q6BXX8_DEBHA|nr:DEHA2A14058p [Debaryomyces hansenii CBS767]CAG84919.2 DEHA2A14058p [Debaryomyces hansenii CBS767]|eukprot:XP_456941.2 DEHA2A14058p [Debaryomyces hansenii CBS767]